jgi:flagellar biosynthesis/type III secretory pathway protein FliH
MQTVNLSRPIRAACIMDAEQWRMADGAGRISDSNVKLQSEIHPPPSDDWQRELQQQKDELAHLLETIQNLTDRLRQLQEQMLTANRSEIAKLAVEIARKILRCKVGRGDYEIAAIVEEALKQAPTRQSIVVRLNPEDLPQCQQLQQENPQGAFAELEFMADWSLGRGECLVETPKGVVKSFLEEHLDRIGEAMQRVE